MADAQRKTERTIHFNGDASKEPCCGYTSPRSCYFFRAMENQDPTRRRACLANCFSEMPLRGDQDHVLSLGALWNIAMTRPDDPELPSLGVLSCMARLIHRGVTDRRWLLSRRNIYIPYYAAHVIGSYTMNRSDFAVKAVESGAISPLIELLRGKLSWVEQRVAVRALGHLASFDATFEAVAAHDEEVAALAAHVASTCVEEVRTGGTGSRQKYQVDLLTRGVGGPEMESRKAEEWGRQLQCWCLNLLNCLACKERGLGLICRPDFLAQLAHMWGGLSNRASPGGVGLIRILCYSTAGRKSVAESKAVVERLCNLSRSSDDWQYKGVDCLLLLLKDPCTRYQVMESAAQALADLVELRSLRDRRNLGEAIIRTLLEDYNRTSRPRFNNNPEVDKALEEVWELKVERTRREQGLPESQVKEREIMAGLMKQEGNIMFRAGRVEDAVAKYTEALAVCPLRARKERMVLHSNKAQGHLLLRDPDSAIRDTTRALSLCSPVNSHGKSLWRRSQAYDMKGLSRESLVDCMSFVGAQGGAKIPHYAACMIGRQIDKACRGDGATDEGRANDDEKLKVKMVHDGLRLGLSTIREEPLMGKSMSMWGRSRGGRLERATSSRRARGGQAGKESSNGWCH